MAPEIRKKEPFNGRKADIFSLGMILFSIVLGMFPFNKHSIL
jgi:serine/threonine protein kinase